ncbi:MAG: DNA-3-methyladenine glycosylase [Vulcanimicrobiaceae bacterium]
MRIRRLERAELPADTGALARYLIGKVLVHHNGGVRQIGRIVESEAYPPGDPAAHSFIGRTARNASLFLERGHAYVYRSYGMHWLFNVSSEGLGIGAGVLIRAVEALAGIDGATNGPGKLAKAMGIDRSFDGIDLCARAALWLGAIDRECAAIASSPRIGISKAREAHLRFFESGNPFVGHRSSRS